MRRLRIAVRVLGTVLLALAVRMVIDGISLLVAVTAVVMAALLVAAVGLTRQENRLEPLRSAGAASPRQNDKSVARP